jgi:hypothetical protein
MCNLQNAKLNGHFWFLQNVEFNGHEYFGVYSIFVQRNLTKWTALY